MNDPTSYDQLAEKIKLLHPFIIPKDISIYTDPIYPTTPHPKIATIASLMNELYTLFISMRYISTSSVSFAPHTDRPISLHHAAFFGLEKQVVDLLQMLPYHDGNSQPNWNYGSDHGEFLFGGEFDDDLRGKENGMEAVWWTKCVDPLYYLGVDWKGQRAIGWNLRCEDVREEGGEMEEESENEEEEEKGWLMTYDAEDDDEAEDADWEQDMIEEDETSSEDSDEFEDDTIEREELLALHQETTEAEATLQKEATLYAQAEAAERTKQHTLNNDPRDERLLLYLRPWHITLNRLGNHGTILFLNTHNFKISQTDQEAGTICNFTHNAIPYLENIIHRFQTLDWIPGGLYSALDGQEYEAYKQLYLECGWGQTTSTPFDGENFDKLRGEYEERKSQRYHDQEPLRKFRHHVSTMQSRELSKLLYSNAVSKLSLLSSTADVKEREKLNSIIEQCGREFLPIHFHPTLPNTLSTYKSQLNDLLDQNHPEINLTYLHTLISETSLTMPAKSFAQKDWILYHFRRKQAMQVDEEMKTGFDWGGGGWRESAPIDLDTILTQEDFEIMARERFDKYHK